MNHSLIDDVESQYETEQVRINRIREESARQIINERTRWFGYGFVTAWVGMMLIATILLYAKQASACGDLPPPDTVVNQIVVPVS